MLFPRPSDPPLPVSLVARLSDDPETRAVGEAKAVILQLAVPRQGEDFETGTFPVEAVALQASTRHTADRLAEGRHVRVEGTLDVCPSLSAEREGRWGLRLRIDDIALAEVDLTEP